MNLLPEEALPKRMREDVEPYLESICRKGELNGELYYELFLPPRAEEAVSAEAASVETASGEAAFGGGGNGGASKGIVVISHGYTEASVKFHEFIYYLLQEGYGCAVMDHRGHGFSIREGRDPNVIYIADFEQYVQDFHEFVHSVVLPAAGDGPLYLYGHSMGGCIAARYLEEWPEDFQKAVLNAPMLGLNMGPMPEWMGILICNVMILFKKGGKRVFFHQEFQPDFPFEKDCASSRARYDYYQELRRQEPALQTSSASYSWIRESILAGKKARAEADRVTVPVLMFQAGDDTLVSEKAQKKFMQKISNGQLVKISGSRHEIYRSENHVLEKYWNVLFSFLN